MRKIRLEEFGGPEVLRIQEFEDPEVPEDGYLVAVKAIGLNFAETVERRGRYKRNQALPYEMGKEAAGVVLARGSKATEFQLGDPVIVVKFDNGCYADRVAARGYQALKPPKDFGFDEMAAFANTYGTAWYAMHEIARVRRGESVLVQAAAGGVGSAAVQLAKSFDCQPVIGTAGSPAKCDFVLSLGADACVNYAREDFRQTIEALCDGGQIDYCLESVGGEVYEHSLEVLAPMGRLVIIGFSSIRENYADAIPRIHPLSLFHRSISVAGLNVDNLKYQKRRHIWQELLDHVEQKGLRPRIGQRFSFEQAPQAHAALEGRRTTGKVVLIVD